MLTRASATDGDQDLLGRVSKFGRLLVIAPTDLKTPTPAIDRNRIGAPAAGGGYRIVVADLLSARERARRQPALR